MDNYFGFDVYRGIEKSENLYCIKGPLEIL